MTRIKWNEADDEKVYRAWKLMERYGSIKSLATRFACSESMILKALERAKAKQVAA